MTEISAVIITLNEEKNIERCLRSLQGVVDEMVVVDAFSSDKTIDLAQQYGAKVFQKSWEGYVRNKNFGNQLASHDYILSIDADEALSAELAKSISTVKSDMKGVYSFNRLTNYCGRWIRHCGWYPDRKIRLFNRREVRWVGDYVHESLEIPRSVVVAHLTGDLYHYSFDSFSDHLQRVDRYSDLAAAALSKQKPSGLIWKMLSSPVMKFFKTYLIKQGFRDGFYGFCISAISAFDIFIRYAKVMHEGKSRRKKVEGKR